jgi:phosphatidylinositol glycan class M
MFLQVAWLQQGYTLEFLGNSAFLPGIYGASLAFFCINIGILGIMIDDLRLAQGTGRS